MRLKKVKNADITIKKGKYYVENPCDYKGRWHELFANNNPIYLEIGIGKGKFILENALNNPNINYIGIEKFDSVLVRAVEKTDIYELNNLKLVRLDALNLESIFDKEIDLIYLNFSDPWPKERHAKRRLTSYVFLNIYDNIFRGNGHIIMKTDNISLFNYSIGSLIGHGYDIIYKTNDLKKENVFNIMTEYEEKFSNLNILINKLEAIYKKN